MINHQLENYLVNPTNQSNKMIATNIAKETQINNLRFFSYLAGKVIGFFLR
jgi:hypothetical protein